MLWHVGDEDKKKVTTNSLLYLSLRSLRDKSYFLRQTSNEEEARNKPKFGGKLSDIKRVYSMRKAFFSIDLQENHRATKTIRQQLLRCTPSHLYLSERQGQKFLSFLLSLEQIRDKMYATIVNQLTVITNHKASIFGRILLDSWTTTRSEWLSCQLTTLAEQATLIRRKQFSSNLMTVMSTFRTAKKIRSVDLLIFCFTIFLV